ncbi:MAG: PH domain-containing protein [Clostridia bacterium]|nr:PH domain-containing protein [Clostridia bacterium]
MSEVKYLWRARKRTLFGLPLSFTVYKLTNEKLMIESGFLNKKEEEIRLYRILDITLRRSLGERLFGLGTIHCCSADKSTPEFDISRIRNAAAVKEQLSDLVETERTARRVSSRELMAGDGDELGDSDHDS